MVAPESIFQYRPPSVETEDRHVQKGNEKLSLEVSEEVLRTGARETQSERELEPEFKERADEEEVTAALETAQTLAEPTEIPTAFTREEKTKKYLEKHLPEYLKCQAAVGVAMVKTINLFFRLKEKIGLFNVEGRENIPDNEPFLIVCNHRGGETGKILALFGGRKVHISAGEELNFKRSKFREELLKKLGMIPVKESLAYIKEKWKTLSDDMAREEAKKEFLARVPRRSRAGYEKILARETTLYNREFIRTSVAALLKGEPVVIFPEGLFTYEGDGLRQAYGGWELIVSEYKRVTGKDLLLLPTGLTKDSVTVGQTRTLNEVADTDGLMRKVAELLPENMRGMYSE